MRFLAFPNMSCFYPIMRKLLIFGVVAFAAVSAGAASAFDSAVVRTTMQNGSVSSREIRMEKLAERFDGRDVYRVRVPVREIPRDARYIDIVADVAKAHNGDSGWYVMPDGSFIEFTQDNGSYSYNRRMPLMGFKTPNGSAAIIVKGLGLEFNKFYKIILTGGGSLLYEKYLREFFNDPRLVIQDNAVMANCRGFWLLGNY